VECSGVGSHSSSRYDLITNKNFSPRTLKISYSSSWQDCTFLISCSSNKKLISSWTVWTYVLSYWYVLHHNRCPYRGASQSYSIHTYAHFLSSCSSGAYDMDMIDQTSAFFIGVILGTALLAQKCQALIDATKASCVPFSSHTVNTFCHTRCSTFTVLLFFVFDFD
jgi:hypothetical protein